MTSSEFDDAVRQILSTPVQNLSRLFDAREPLEDCIEHARVSTTGDFRRMSMFAPESHLQTRLGHVSVNPSDPANTAILRSAYVYASNEPTKSRQRTDPLNQHPDVAARFIRDLISRAKEFRDLSVGAEPLDPTGRVLSTARNFLIVGERGSGKTFFINHLFSRFHDLLNEEKVVWVRVNLVPDRGYDDDIHRWIYAQTAKILLRYYDSDSARTHTMPPRVRFPFYATLRTWISTSFVGDQAARYVDDLEEMRQVFSIRHNDQEISNTLCHPILCMELFRLARLQGLSFIIVLDGLDRLESDHYYTKRFSDISLSVRKLWNSYELLGAIFIYVSRGETFSAHRNVAPYNLFDPSVQFSLKPIDIQRILAARITALVAEVEALQRSRPDIWSTRDWVYVLRGFQERMLNGTENENLDYLESTFGVNNRAKVQILQLKFQEYVQDATRQGYRLIEHMMLAGRRYPPLFYKYLYVDGHLEIVIPDQSHIESRYLPIITRPPAVDCAQARKEASEWYSPGSLLLGLRVLQLVVGFEDWVRAQDATSEPIVVREIADVLQAAFSYDKRQVIAAVWEFENYEILRGIYDGNGVERTENSYIGTYPKARYILGYCMRDVAFLNICAMRTAIRRSEHKFPPLFRHAYLSLDEEKSLGRWVFTKMMNATVLATIVNTINQEQASHFSRGLRKIDVRPDLQRMLRSAGHETFFGFAEEMKSTIERELAGVYRSVQDEKASIHIPHQRIMGTLRGIGERLFGGTSGAGSVR